MKSWKEITLGDDYIVTNAKTLNKDYPFSEIFYLDTGSITKGKVDNYQKIALKNAPSRAKRLLSNNDIIYSSVRPANRHYGFFSNPIHNLVVSTGFIVITCNEKKLCPLFLYYYLAQEQIVEELHSIAEGSTSAYPSLLPTDIESMVISIPPTIHEQRAIAAVLSSLDDKIELLHRQNATLESMAEALFRKWFVVEAKEVWKEFAINEITYQIKKSISPQNHPHKNFYYYSIPAYDLNKNPEIVCGKSILSNKFIVENNCILISKLNPQFPRIWYIMEEVQENSVSSTEFISVKPYDQQELPFIYCLLKNHDVSSELAKSASGTSGSHQRIKPEDIFSVTFSAPSRQYLTKFSNQVLPIYRRIQINNAQINTLEKLRDTLLPKLMSGEIRVDF